MDELEAFLRRLNFDSKDALEDTYGKLCVEMVGFSQLDSITDEEFVEIGISLDVVRKIRAGLETEAAKRKVLSGDISRHDKHPCYVAQVV
jgi:hypothetical protein